MKKLYLLILVSFLLQSCKKVIIQPTVLLKNCNFDLEISTFNENVSQLYSSHILDQDDIQMDSTDCRKVHDSVVKYRISNLMSDAIKIKVPQKAFGFLYKSPEMDSIAKFQNTYFRCLKTLTDNSKKPIAFYAETQFKNSKDSKKALLEMIKKYGKPTHEFGISSEFNQNSYEWVLKNKTIQIETSFGWSANFSSDGKTSNSKYYRYDFLMIKNQNKPEIYKAHQYTFPEKILYDGKYISYKDFQLEKIQIFADDFLLNSTFDHFIKNENGLYNINIEDEEP